MKKKVVLAYSGGLDTSCCIPWLKEKGFEVICFSANLGSEFSPADLKKRAIKTGALRIYVKDLRREFVAEYILPALQANAVYEGKYVLSTSLGRPLIARHLVDIAHKEKAGYVAHGCTGKGNDQVRIEATIKMLDPRLKIIAPLREWELTSRESEIAYAKRKKVPIKTTREKIYSIDKNIWGVSIEGGRLEDLETSFDDRAAVFTRPLEKTPDRPEIVSLEFAQGVPVKLNGKKKDFLAIIDALNVTGGKHCIGRSDLIEDRTVGIKSRETYEAPAAWILLLAHRELEQLVLDKDTLAFKEFLSQQYSRLAYQGLWFSTLRQSMDAFVRVTQQKVSGKIRLKLYKGSMYIAGRESRNALYKKELATYGEKDAFNREDSRGFINIFSMPYMKR